MSMKILEENYRREINPLDPATTKEVTTRSSELQFKTTEKWNRKKLIDGNPMETAAA